MTKDSGLQVAPSRRPTRERVGLIADGANGAAATKTIAAAEAAGYGKSGWDNHLFGQIH